MTFNEDHWKPLSSEARDLVAKMLARDPNDRISAQEALNHPWFHIDHSQSGILASAQDNMAKYNAHNRFNLEKIKPEFSMISCTPLLNSRHGGGEQSPVRSPHLPRPFVPNTPLATPSPLNKSEEEKRVWPYSHFRV